MPRGARYASRLGGDLSARSFIAVLVAVVACTVILYATFFAPEVAAIAQGMVAVLTALITGLLASDYLDRRRDGD